MKQLTILILFIGVLVFGTSCKSQKTNTASSDQPKNQRERKGPPSVDEVFKMDTNKDGKLSKAEVKGPLAKDFSKIDTNNDGFISKAELKNAPKPDRGQRPPRG